MKASELDPSTLTDELLDRLLFRGLGYQGQQADAIMVLGSKKACVNRVPPAAELIRAGKSRRLLLCGGKIQDTPRGTMPEYRSMEQAALELGIPRESILTETRSMTTAENLVLGGEVLTRALPECQSLILVTGDFHMRRALSMAKRLLPDLTVHPCPAPGGSSGRENWKNSEKGRKRVLDEWGKLEYYIRIGYIDDIEL